LTRRGNTGVASGYNFDAASKEATASKSAFSCVKMTGKVRRRDIGSQGSVVRIQG
jgi:hypothetical protein